PRRDAACGRQPPAPDRSRSPTDGTFPAPGCATWRRPLPPRAGAAHRARLDRRRSATVRAAAGRIRPTLVRLTWWVSLASRLPGRSYPVSAAGATLGATTDPRVRENR